MQPYGADISAIEALTGTGLAVRTASDTWQLRQVTNAGGGFTITNPAGVAGDINVELNPIGLTLKTTPAVGDQLILGDSAASNAPKYITADRFMKIINGLTEDTAPDGAADFFPSWDNSASVAKKVKPNTILGLVAGLTEDTTPDSANDFLLSSDTSASAPKKVKPANLSIAATQLTGTIAAARMPALTGDVTTSAGAVATTIANDAVTNAKAANMAQNTVKGRITASTGDPEDLTATQLRTILGMGDAYALNKASTSDLLSGTANVMSMDNVESALAYSALTDGATITPNFNSARRFTLTIGGNRTLANPSNQRAGQDVVIVITQDGTGGRTLAYGSAWKFPGGAPTLSTAAGAVDVIAGVVQANGTIRAVLNKAFA